MWAALVFGWPAIIVALAAFGLAICTDYKWFGVAGAIVAAPFCVFVSGYPLFHWAGAIAGVANFGAALLIHRRRRDIAFTALLPFMIIVTILAVFEVRHIRLMR